MRTTRGSRDPFLRPLSPRSLLSSLGRKADSSPPNAPLWTESRCGNNRSSASGKNKSTHLCDRGQSGGTSTGLESEDRAWGWLPLPKSSRGVSSAEAGATSSPGCGWPPGLSQPHLRPHSLSPFQPLCRSSHTQAELGPSWGFAHVPAPRPLPRVLFLQTQARPTPAHFFQVSAPRSFIRGRARPPCIKQRPIQGRPIRLTPWNATHLYF